MGNVNDEWEETLSLLHKVFHVYHANGATGLQYLPTGHGAKEIMLQFDEAEVKTSK